MVHSFEHLISSTCTVIIEKRLKKICKFCIYLGFVTQYSPSVKIQNHVSTTIPLGSPYFYVSLVEVF